MGAHKGYRIVENDNTGVPTFTAFARRPGGYDIRPTNRCAIVLPGGELGAARWGWTRDFATGGRIINARWETATEKRTFAEAVDQRRCVIPATGYYEWQRDDRDRPIKGGKHAFRATDGSLLAMAGLWEDAGTPDVAPDERITVRGLPRQRGLSVRAFAKLVGVGVSSVSAAKRRAIDPARIEPWADALGLAGRDRARFVRMAWLSRTQPVIVALVDQLERQLARRLASARLRTPGR